MSTGELWTSLEQINSNNLRKWLYGTVLVRDWDPAGTTSLAGFTPFEADGSLKSTLFDDTNPGGRWFDVGAIESTGVTFQPLYKTVDTDIWQSRLPQRTDVNSDGEDVEFTCAETNGVALQLYNNLPLVDVPGTGAKSVVPIVGANDFSVQYSTTPQIIYRQLLILGVDGELANPIYVAELRPRVSIVSLGKKGRMFNAKTQDAFDLSFGVYIDPASGYAKDAIYGGPAWLAMGNAAFVSTAPVATAETGTKATIAFTTPVGLDTPTYTVTQQVGGTGAYTSSTLSGSPVVSGNTTTLTVSGLTAASDYKFEVTATPSSGTALVSQPSNSVVAEA